MSTNDPGRTPAMTVTPDTLRAESRAAALEAHASFERCDTDGFMSQWASGLTSRQRAMEADLMEAGGVHEFAALFDLDGNLVPAKLMQTRYGTAWALLATENPSSRITGWVNPSKARSAEARNRANAKKGYSVGRVLAPAQVVMRGDNMVNVRPIIVRTDGGFSTTVKIVTTEQTEDWS